MAALALAGAALAVPASDAAAQQGVAPDDEASVVAVALAQFRFGAADRYETSLLVAQHYAELRDGKLSSVVLVSGERWTDAVVAAPLAGSLGAPVLMMPPGELRRDAVDFLQETGVTKAIVIGSPSSDAKHGPGRGLSDTALSGLAGIGIKVERVHGSDRFGTGVAVAERLSAGDMPGLGNTVFVASGDVFADALVAGPIAALGVHPVLLTTPGELHPDVADYLRVARARDGVRHVVVMGGTAALAPSVEQSIVDAGIRVTRLAGATRYDTAILAAELVEDRYEGPDDTSCFTNVVYGVARADVPFDSFSAAPLLGRLCVSLLLTDPGAVPVPTAVYLDLKMLKLTEETEADLYLMVLYVFGGEAAVASETIEAYLAEATTRIAEGRAGEIEPDAGESEDGEDGDGGDGDDDESSASGDGQPGATAKLDCGGSIGDSSRQLVPSTNAEDPAWSPDCSRLVYTDNGSLWLVDNDGSNRRRLLDRRGAYLTSAAWSPDGSKIAYVRGYQDGDRWVSHIWSVKPDGSGRTQLTHGDTRRDRWPRWSPDGAQIVFDREEDGDEYDNKRFIATMNADGKQEQTLNDDDVPLTAPVLSPDGSKLAFILKESLFIADADGGIDDMVPWQLVSEYVYPRGEIAWSPSGNRIAFARATYTDAGIRSDIHIADIDGSNEEQVSDLDGQALAPRWSPDGKLLAFHTITDDGKHRSFVVGASGTPVGRADDCRPEGQFGYRYHAGFPRPTADLPTTGKMRIGVLFVDFEGASAIESVDAEIERNLPRIEEIFERSSYGKLDVEFVPHRKWLRSSLRVPEDLDPNTIALRSVPAEAVKLAGDNLDLSSLDSVLVVLPSTHFWYRAHTPVESLEGSSPPLTLVNLFHSPNRSNWNLWGDTVADHYLTTGRFGLPNLWTGSTGRPELPDPPSGKSWIGATWGRRGLKSYFLADTFDPRLRATHTHADGKTTAIYSHDVGPEEMLAWTRWKLDWFDPGQVACVAPRDSTFELAPIAEPGDGLAMVAVPVNQHEVIVVESRRKIGADADAPRALEGGAQVTDPRLLEEGVLVYTVDSWSSGFDPQIKLAGDLGDGRVDGFPVLTVGESVTVRGYKISVEADTGDAHRVRIRKVN